MAGDTPPTRELPSSPGVALLSCAFAVNRMSEQLARIYDMNAHTGLEQLGTTGGLIDFGPFIDGIGDALKGVISIG